MDSDVQLRISLSVSADEGLCGRDILNSIHVVRSRAQNVPRFEMGIDWRHLVSNNWADGDASCG